MARREARDDRRHLLGSQVARAGEPDRAARRGRRCAGQLLGFLQFRQQLHAALVKRLPTLGQRQFAGGAVQKAGAQVLLEGGDLPGNRRGRRAQALCGPRKASGLDDANEGLNGGDPIHRSIMPKNGTITFGVPGQLQQEEE